jgi:microcin C transport system ATP-binding protein
VSEGLAVHGIARGEPRMRVAEILQEVGLRPGDDGPLSARVLRRPAAAHRDRARHDPAPRLVVLDEPTSALDMTVQVQIVELLRGCRRDHGLAYLFISHDLKVVRALSHHVIVMRQGDVVETGSAEDLFHNPRHEYTRELMRAAFGETPGTAA